jgi:hypothetical protein
MAQLSRLSAELSAQAKPMASEPAQRFQQKWEPNDSASRLLTAGGLISTTLVLDAVLSGNVDRGFNGNGFVPAR